MNGLQSPCTLLLLSLTLYCCGKTEVGSKKNLSHANMRLAETQKNLSLKVFAKSVNFLAALHSCTSTCGACNVVCIFVDGRLVCRIVHAMLIGTIVRFCHLRGHKKKKEVSSPKPRWFPSCPNKNKHTHWYVIQKRTWCIQTTELRGKTGT